MMSLVWLRYTVHKFIQHFFYKHKLLQHKVTLEHYNRVLPIRLLVHIEGILFRIGFIKAKWNHLGSGSFKTNPSHHRWFSFTLASCNWFAAFSTFHSALKDQASSRIEIMGWGNKKQQKRWIPSNTKAK